MEELNLHNNMEGGEEVMVSDDAQRIIDELTGEKLHIGLSSEDTELFRRVLLDMTKDYLMLKRSPEEVIVLLQNNAKFIVEDLKDILARFDFSEEDARRAASHMAKILEDDIELKDDLDKAEEFIHKLNTPEHSFDSRLNSFSMIVMRNPRIGDILAIMIDGEEEDKLASLAPADERESYLERFRELYEDFLKAKRSGDEWRTSPEETEFLVKYILKFAHEFLRTDVKKLKPA